MTNAGAHFGGIAFPRISGRLVLHLSIGADLVCMGIDRGDFMLTEISRLTLPAPVQYVWPHPTRPLLYVASSNRSISKSDDLHALTTVELHDRTGAMRRIGEVPLPSRPIHLTLDGSAATALVVYNAPGLVTLHKIDDAGIAGSAVPQASPVNAGIFPHQVLMLPSRKAAIIVARGNHARGDLPEEPGSLEFLALRDAQLTNIATVAPNGGHEFGPRHLDFHPDGHWAAVSMERQNELQVFEVLADRLAPAPAHRRTTLERPAPASHNQLSGTLHFHPDGRTLYVANRHDSSVYGDGTEPSDFAGNNVAVYRFDAETGRPEPIQHIATESVHVRTFSLDASATLLVTASILPALWRRHDTVETVPSRLTFFRVASDGQLTLAAIHDIDGGRAALFWSHLNGTL